MAIQTTSASIKETLQNPTQYTASFRDIAMQARTENLYKIACSEFLAVHEYPRQDSNKATSQTIENALDFDVFGDSSALDAKLSAAKALLLERVRGLVACWLRCPESVRDQVLKLMQETQTK